VLVIYDATDFQAYGDDEEVMVALFGHSGGRNPGFAMKMRRSAPLACSAVAWRSRRCRSPFFTIRMLAST
jgi:hypothetical protein